MTGGFVQIVPPYAFYQYCHIGQYGPGMGTAVQVYELQCEYIDPNR